MPFTCRYFKAFNQFLLLKEETNHIAIVFVFTFYFFVPLLGFPVASKALT